MNLGMSELKALRLRDQDDRPKRKLCFLWPIS
jgi:hypothetical protein